MGQTPSEVKFLGGGGGHEESSHNSKNQRKAIRKSSNHPGGKVEFASPTKKKTNDFGSSRVTTKTGRGDEKSRKENSTCGEIWRAF